MFFNLSKVESGGLHNLSDSCCLVKQIAEKTPLNFKNLAWSCRSKNDASEWAKLIEIAPSVHDKSGPRTLPNDLRESDGTPSNSESK